MDLTLLHPKIVHLPIALAVLMPLIAGSLTVAWWREWLPRKVWWMAIVMQIVLVGSSIAAGQTGEIDEEVAERVVAEQYIEAHEEAAEVFTAASAAVLLLALLAGVIRNERAARGLATTAAFSTLVVFGLGYRVGEAGGELVYKHGAAQAFTGSSTISAIPTDRHVDDD